MLSSQSSCERTDSYDADVDMRDTETHPGSGGGDSDRDSTTVSYSLDEDNLREVEEEVEDLGYKEERDRIELQEYPPRPEVPPPRYEDIINENQELLPSSPPSPPPPGRLSEDGEEKQVTPTPSDHVPIATSAVPKQTHGSIEFPLTHFYELESRVHTEQWSIPYKREESLAICMVATIKMIREGT